MFLLWFSRGSTEKGSFIAPAPCFVHNMSYNTKNVHTDYFRVYISSLTAGVWHVNIYLITTWQHFSKVLNDNKISTPTSKWQKQREAFQCDACVKIMTGHYEMGINSQAEIWSVAQWQTSAAEMKCHFPKLKKINACKTCLKLPLKPRTVSSSILFLCSSLCSLHNLYHLSYKGTSEHWLRAHVGVVLATDGTCNLVL